MAFETSINTDKICRTCLSEENNMRSVFSIDESNGEALKLHEMLMSCASVQVMEDDGLPDQVCIQCTHHIIRSFSFKQLCERSESTLRQILGQPSQSYMELKPYQQNLDLDISDQKDDLEPKFESVDVDISKIGSDSDGSDNLNEETRLTNNQTLIKRKKVKDDTKQKLYPCEECTQCFTTAMDLKFHRRTHPKKSTKHICKICQQGFASASTLCRHMKVHDGAKRHLCNECGKGFTRSDDLTRHLRIHTGEKPFPCKLCGKSFSQSFRLLEHMRAHANKKSFVCPICSKAFSRYTSLTAHNKTHSGIKTHECKLCGKR